MQRRLVIHVSGMPGSGKTTLGKHVSDMSGGRMRVVELDTLLPPGSAADAELAAIDRTADWPRYRERWAELMQHQLDIVLRAHGGMEGASSPPLLLVGILQHFSGPPDEPLVLPGATHRFFIDPPDAQLLQQFYGRYTRELGDNYGFWMDVAAGRYLVPASDELVRDAERCRVWHAEHGYTRGSAMAVLREISALL